MGKSKKTQSQKVQVAIQNHAELQQLLSKLPEEQRNGILRQITVEQHYEGPIPHPVLLEQFNSIIPNGAERIFKMAESEQKHRHRNTNWMVADAIIRRICGLLFGVALIALLIYVAYLFGMAGHTKLAGTIFTVTIISIGVIFVLFREPNHGGSKKK